MGRRLLNCLPHLPDIIYYSAVHGAHTPKLGFASVITQTCSDQNIYATIQTRRSAHIMAFVRVKYHNKRPYYYLVETYREGGKVKQRTLRYIGTRPPKGRQRGLKGSR